MENIVDKAREILLKEAEALGLGLMKTRPTRIIRWLVDKELNHLRTFAKKEKHRKDVPERVVDIDKAFKQMSLF